LRLGGHLIRMTKSLSSLTTKCWTNLVCCIALAFNDASLTKNQPIEVLQGQATQLQSSITKLTEAASTAKAEPPSSANSATEPSHTEQPSARNQVISVFTACLPVLRGRIANLSMAQDLVDSALENASLDLRMRSMGLVD